MASHYHYDPRFLEAITAILIFLLGLFLISCPFIANFVINEPKIPEMRLLLDSSSVKSINNGDKATIHHVASASFYENIFNHAEFEDVELRGHGNSTWHQPKSSYQIKFKDEVDFFDMGSAKKWILLSNYYDDSYIRNSTAYKLQDLLGINYSPKGKFIDLYINEDYIGLYFLTTKVEIADTRVNLRSPSGILVEFDNLHNNLYDNDCYSSTFIACLAVKDTVAKDESSSMPLFLSKLNEAELAITRDDLDTLLAKIDLESFAKYFLLSELTSNPDAYSASIYMYADHPADKIHIGPGWDYDLAFANSVWNWASFDDYFSPSTKTPQLIHAANESISYQDIITAPSSDLAITRIFEYLLKKPVFMNTLSNIINKNLKNQKKSLLDNIESEITYIQDSIEKDTTKYQKSPSVSQEFVKSWLSARYNYVIETYGN